MGRASGSCIVFFSYFPSFRMNGVERRGWHLRIHYKKNMRKPESAEIRQRGNRFGSGSVLLIGLSVVFLTWLRGDIEGFCVWIIHL